MTQKNNRAESRKTDRAESTKSGMASGKIGVVMLPLCLSSHADRERPEAVALKQRAANQFYFPRLGKVLLEARPS